MNLDKPNFTIERLGPAQIESPLVERYGRAGRIFVGDDERALFDTTGYSWHHHEALRGIDNINLEVAGPREFKIGRAHV